MPPLRKRPVRGSSRGQADSASMQPHVQGFCELKYSEAVARHAAVDGARTGSGFVSGRTTAVLPSDAPNLFGIGSI